MSRYNTHLEIMGVEDVPVTVHYIHAPFRAGKTDGKDGPKLEPDEPERIEIDWIELPDSRAYEPTTKLKSALEDEVGDWLQGMYDPPEPQDAE